MGVQANSHRAMTHVRRKTNTIFASFNVLSVAICGLTSKVTGADETPAMTCYAGRRPVDRDVRPQQLHQKRPHHLRLRRAR